MTLRLSDDCTAYIVSHYIVLPIVQFSLRQTRFSQLGNLASFQLSLTY